MGLNQRSGIFISPSDTPKTKFIRPAWLSPPPHPHHVQSCSVGYRGRGATGDRPTHLPQPSQFFHILCSTRQLMTKKIIVDFSESEDAGPIKFRRLESKPEGR